MDKNPKKLPSGVSILKYFYLLNILSFGLVIVLFYRYVGIMVLGAILPGLSSAIAKWVLIVFPLYLYLDLKNPNPRVFFAMLCYHIFFLINSISTIPYILNKPFIVKPLLQVVNIDEVSLDVLGDVGYTTKHISVHVLNIIIAIIILAYILRKRALFLKTI